MRMSAIAAIVAAVTLSACTPTSIASTWKKPGLEPAPLRNAVVFAGITDESIRRTLEDEMTARLGIRAVAAWSLVARSDAPEQLRARAIAGKFDSIIVMRLVSVDRDSEWVAGRWAGRYYDLGSYEPGDVNIDSGYVRIETQVYALPREELIWAATSESASPTTIKRLISETVEVVVREMNRQGLLPAPGSEPVALRPGP